MCSSDDEKVMSVGFVKNKLDRGSWSKKILGIYMFLIIFELLRMQCVQKNILHHFDAGFLSDER